MPRLLSRRSVRYVAVAVFVLLASALGIGRALKGNPGTGFILLFDEQRRVKGKLTARQTLKEMAAAICTQCE